MRKIKSAPRLKFDAQLSHERIDTALGISKGVVAKYVSAAAEAALQHRLLVPAFAPKKLCSCISAVMVF